jgi:D-xylose transport system permease protein
MGVAENTYPKGAPMGPVPAVVGRFSSTVEMRTWRLIALVMVTVVLGVVFHALTDGVFLTNRNLSNLTVQMSITGLVAMGMTWLLIAREIDLSVGSLLAVVGVVTVLVQVEGSWNTPTTVALGLAIGVFVGLFQGLCTAKFAIPSLIVTLAGFSYLRGAAYVIPDGEILSGTNNSFYEIANGSFSPRATAVIAVASYVGVASLWLWNRPDLWRHPRSISNVRRLRRVDVVAALAATALMAVGGWVFLSYRGLPYPVALVFAVLAVMSFISRFTAFGRHIYAIGGNPEAARRVGVKVPRTVTVLFVVSALLAALAGIVQASRLDSGPPDAGQLVPLDAIIASVIGGTSLFGGYGSVTGAVLGALLLTTILNGLSLMAINSFYQYIAIGLILLAAVAIDTATQRRLQHD